MKRLAAFFSLILSADTGSAQEYRLSYDSSTIPELYYHTTLVLQEKTGDHYQTVKGKYKLHTEMGEVSGQEYAIDPATAHRVKGLIPFEISIKGKRVATLLQVPVLSGLRFSLYTDSIKPILNYYVNVEGIFSTGRVFPLSDEHVMISSDVGDMAGMEWIAPKVRNFDRVVFTVFSKYNPDIRISRTVFLQQYVDPRDAEGYEDGRK